VSVAALFCKNGEKIYDKNILNIFDRITERHLIKAIEEIKTDVRQNSI
jgi:hypothetical protein